MDPIFVRALLFGVFGALVAWLLAEPLATTGLQFWAVIAGWAAIAAGGSTVLTAIAGCLWGAAMATVALVIAVILGAGSTLVAILAGAALAIALAGQGVLKVLAARPAILIGFATTWGYAKLARLDATNFYLGVGPFTTIALSLLAGVLLGRLIEALIGVVWRR
jgi:hypothetical protein